MSLASACSRAATSSGRQARPDATILSVSYDPGVPIVYASFALLILGIAWGLREVRRKTEQAVQSPGRRRSTPAGEPAMAPRGARGGAAPAAHRAGARILGLLFAVLAGLVPAADGWAQPAAVSATGRDARLPVEETRSWAILADGRVKPLLTYANETTLAVTGRERFDGMNALEILWGYVLEPSGIQRPSLHPRRQPGAEGDAGAGREPEALLVQHADESTVVPGAGR